MRSERGVVLMSMVINGYTCTDGSSSVSAKPNNLARPLYSPPPSKETLERAFSKTFSSYSLSFDDCVKLTTLPTIPAGVTRLYCRRCKELTKIKNIPNTIKTISFTSCTKLATVPAIPSSVKDLDSCFAGCVSLEGIVEINSTNITDFTGCLSNTEKFIYVCGTNSQLSDIAATANNGNAEAFTPPGTTPTWQTPVINRMAESRTAASDMQRIAGNLYLCGGYPYRIDYTSDMFVSDIEWKCVVLSVNNIADVLEVAHITDSTSYENFNKLESILLLKHNS